MTLPDDTHTPGPRMTKRESSRSLQRFSTTSQRTPSSSGTSFLTKTGPRSEELTTKTPSNANSSNKATVVSRVPKMPKPEAQCEYDGYRKKSIKNKFALPKKTVKKVETIVAYHYHLKSIVVNRIKETSRRPYRPGEKLSTPDKGKAPKLWKIECNEQNGERVTIPFTSEKAICPVCRCSKSEPCNQCHGFGRTPCYFCNGDGRISKIETHCITSHDGDSTPHTVHHSYACHHCHGQAMEMCAGCFGTGRCTCRTCKGSGYVVNYDEMIIKRYEMVNEYYTEVPGLDEKKLQKSEAKIIFHDKGKSLRPIQFKDCCQEEMVNASSAYLQYQAKKSTGKIRHQTHSVNLFEIYKVTFYDSKHIFWITGKNRKPSVSNNSQCKVM